MMERLTNSEKEIPALVNNAEYWLQVYFKLKDIEDLEEQGLLLRLPCAENTTVYVIEDDCTELSDYCRRKGNCKDCPCRDLHIEPEMFSLSGIVLRLKDFGKTVFLTQSEAEQKLKEMEDK